MRFRLSMFLIVLTLSIPCVNAQVRRGSRPALKPSTGSAGLSIDWKSLEGMYPREAFRRYPGLVKKIRTILGKKYITFSRNLSVQGVFEGHDDALFARGCAPHSCGSEESYFAIDLITGKLSFGIVSSIYDEDIVIVLEDPNGTLPAPLQQEVDQLEEARATVAREASERELRLQMVRSIREVETDQLRFVSKPIVIDGTIGLSTYYNYRYANAKGTHLAFELTDSSGRAHAYMQRGASAEELRNKLLAVNGRMRGSFKIVILANRFDPDSSELLAELIDFGPSIYGR